MLLPLARSFSRQAVVFRHSGRMTSISGTAATTTTAAATARRSLSVVSMSSTASSPPPPHADTTPKDNNNNNSSPDKKKAHNQNLQVSNTGGLRRLPVVRQPQELLNKAHKEAKWVKPDLKMKNIRNRARKHGAETLNSFTNILCIPLRDTVKGYQAELRRLHPFERVVADLTVRARQKKDGLTLNLVLEDIHEARKMVRETGVDWIAKVKSAETAREAGTFLEEGLAAVTELFEQYASEPVANLVDLQRGLRSAPIVALDTPAVVLVGSPNVGKSSIVRHISSGTPEVNNYPFTTRGMTLGHVEVFWSDNDTVARAVIPQLDRKPGALAEDVILGKYAFSQLCQVMDSPGLLVRPENERNEMEALTMAAMQHLPTAVMFVMDLSGGAGDRCSHVADQLKLRRDIRARFPRRPWIDVVSKYDLDVVPGALEELQEIRDTEEAAPSAYVKLSVHEDIGVDELRNHVLRVLGEVRVVLDAMLAVDTRTMRRDAGQ